MQRTIHKVLVANRGVPAVRIMHTCRDRKIPTTAVYSTPDRLAYHVFMADTAIHIGDAPPINSYLNGDRIIEAALASGSNAIHPGWGFLAENADFAQKVIDAGLIWIGPQPDVIRMMGDKIQAKEIARRSNVPTIPGIENVTSAGQITDWMRDQDIAFPIMIKAASGGGGKGMVRVDTPDQIPVALAQARSEAKKAFGDDTVLVEKYIEHGRHIEVQVVADEHRHVVHLFERECTLQRRNQKIIEEAPSTLENDLRQEICVTAARLMRRIGYTSAGTVEFLFDPATQSFYFLEVNTRLQVEHGITELITGLDIVSIMLDVAEGKPLPIKQLDVVPNRCALEVRLNAEDPKTFAPSFGKITRLRTPLGPNVRVLLGAAEGEDIPPYYDSLFMLLMTSGADRADALRVMDRALTGDLRIEGIKTLAPLLLSIIRHPKFIAGDFSTKFIEQHLPELVSGFRERTGEDEMLRVAQYVAEISALGPQSWM
ncbi:acetyl-CoA carboxylase biotin carboxylase subunit [Roseiflexus castenholzii]|uniref:biotin carboxylase n=1 Tax=Roseiflexus castenholzii (strain DSM 13941 / HLO8) TaxID=383372 RepID=A7NN82_ROSCS|nr:biotin carboxylase N-terminal domain-containing protein [Roseiflexus castenholzii]ABU59015.1 Carbamoyl-phosphate synthase L chain ATP-binding [Roseiflexus castenholzii DSM 13941]